MPDSERPAPVLTQLDRPFWTGGAAGALRMQRCVRCTRICHPPALRCPRDHAVLEFVELSGRGVVESWTINRHQWFPGFQPPYVIAFVNPVEDLNARLLTNLVNVEPDEISQNMLVRVVFDQLVVGEDEVYIPLFEPEH
ncbi:Zn-ribbon domain-containing OB-fold protein [Mycobacterium vicinigordonae]|nr:OB-fold domain-containing protein [Mycobacterium vicinigordonae]